MSNRGNTHEENHRTPVRIANISAANRNWYLPKTCPEHYGWPNLIGRSAIFRTERLTVVKNNLHIAVVSIPLKHQPTDSFDNNNRAATGMTSPSQLLCLRPYRKKALTSVARTVQDTLLFLFLKLLKLAPHSPALSLCYAHVIFSVNKCPKSRKFRSDYAVRTR